MGPSWGERLEMPVRIAPVGLSWGPLGALLGHLGGPRGRLRALLGRLGAPFGPSWGPHRTSWDDFGGPSGRFRRCQDNKTECAKNVRFPKGMGRFFLLGALSAVLRGHSWAVLEASCAVLKPSWTVAGLPWAVSTLSSTVLALCLGSLGPSWGFLEAPEAPGELVPPPLNGILDPRGGGKGEGDSQMSHTPFHPRQAGVGGFPNGTVIISPAIQTRTGPVHGRGRHYYYLFQ